MSEPTPTHNQPQLAGHVIIAGYGVVGRAVADMLTRRGIPFCVVELNSATVTRAIRIGTQIVEGDVRQEEILLAAGLRQARALALALPDEQQVLHTLRVARAIHPTIPILARCTFSSAGLAALQCGATEVVVAEQVVARECAAVFEALLRP